MKAWLVKDDPDLFSQELIELPAGAARLTVGRAADADVRFDSARVSRRHCYFVSEGGAWRVEVDPSSTGTFHNGERISRAELTSGDRIDLFAGSLTFLAAAPARHPELEARIDADPDDPGRVQVWADWLHEQGDPLARQLLGESAPRDFSGAPQVQLTWRHGLVHTARLRNAPSVLTSLARLLSLRAARWTRELHVELSNGVDVDPGQLQRAAGHALRGLLTGGRLPALERLSFGAWPQALPEESLLPELVARLPARFPRLVTPLGELFAPTRLELELPASTPAGLDFYAPTAVDGRVRLERGAWVGASARDQLRVMTPGIPRTTEFQSFLVRDQALRYCFVPLEPGLSLNGAPAFETRLLPGDVIADRRGVAFTVRRSGV